MSSEPGRGLVSGTYRAHGLKRVSKGHPGEYVEGEQVKSTGDVPCVCSPAQVSGTGES